MDTKQPLSADAPGGVTTSIHAHRLRRKRQEFQRYAGCFLVGSQEFFVPNVPQAGSRNDGKVRASLMPLSSDSAGGHEIGGQLRFD